MADENSILGTSGKEAIPFEYQSEEQRIARKRAMAQVMLQKGLAGPRQTQMFGIHASTPGIGEHMISALQTYMGMKGQTQADQDQTDMTQRMMGEQQGDVRGALEQYNADPKAGIAQALTSKFGRVNSMGAQWQKDRQGMLLEQGKLLGGSDPVAGIQHLQSGDPSRPVAPIATPPLEFGKDPSGNPYVVTNDMKGGKPQVTYAPKEATTTINNKLVGDANDEAIKYWNYGGKGYEKAAAATQSLQSNANVLATMDQNPQMGAGASAFQAARKIASSLGIATSDATTPSEMAQMQLGAKVLDRLGGTLGAQVSDADRDFMLSIQGNIGSDPEAVRRLLLIESKYLMQVQAKANAAAQEVAGRVPVGANGQALTLPQHTFSMTPSKRNADDLERLFAGQGFAAAPAAPPKQYPGRIRSAK